MARYSKRARWSTCATERLVHKATRKIQSQTRLKGVNRAAIIVCVTFLYILITSVSEQWEHTPLHTVTRLLPRFQREVQRNFGVDWQRALKKAKEQAKFVVTVSNVQVFVISLERLPERKIKTVWSLELQGILWTLHIAVDGLDDLDIATMTMYAGRKKQKRLNITRSLGRKELEALKRDYDDFKYVPFKLRTSLHERLRFGCYMSHVLLWKKILQTEQRLAVVLEDDAVITANFSLELQHRLQKLPAKWDILFLNGCHTKLGYMFDEGLWQLRGGLCTFAYAISSKGARYLLQHAALHSDKPIDHVLDHEILTGRLLAFHVEPPLAYTSLSEVSTLAY